MIQIIEVNQIVQELQSVIPSLMFFDWKPLREDNVPPVYVFVRTVSETTDVVSKQALLEFTFIAKWNVTNKTVRDYIQELTNELIWQNCMRKVKFGDFYVYNITESSMNWPWYGEKWELVYTKQYNFNFMRRN